MFLEEQIISDFNDTGSLWADSAETLGYMLDLLKRKTEYFKFIVACENGGYTISNLADFT